MINSTIETIEYPNNTRIKIQIVNLESWDSLDFGYCKYDKRSFDKLYHLYNDFIVPKFPYAFEKLVLFYIPSDLKLVSSLNTKSYGTLLKPSSVVKNILENGLIIKNDSVSFKTNEALEIYNKLKEKDCLRLVYGKKPGIKALPVSNTLGFMSESETDCEFKVNSSFFTMDRFDIDSIYDSIGVPIGLLVKDGKIINPPLFNREALFVDKNNNVEIKQINIDELMIYLNEELLTDYYIYSRPINKKTPKGGFDIVVINNEVVAYKENGHTTIPSSGYVIKVKNKINITNTTIKYKGLEKYKFAIQVGNSVIKEGVKTNGFISNFYNIYKPFTTSYPPSLYPLNYQKAKAPRIILGEKDNKPIVVWFEGMAKFGFNPNTDSYGASLKEVCDIAYKLGIKNAINLDGGGSAQILINNKRELLISDRDKDSFKEMERAIPLFLKVR